MCIYIIPIYRYNIKLSKAIYPYLAILENALKIKLSNYLKEKYGENFYYNNELIFSSLNFDDFDKEIIKEYFNHKINKFVREELIAKYKENDPNLVRKKLIDLKYTNYEINNIVFLISLKNLNTKTAFVLKKMQDKTSLENDKIKFDIFE